MRERWDALQTSRDARPEPGAPFLASFARKPALSGVEGWGFCSPALTTNHFILVCRRLLRAQSRVRTNQQFVELILRRRFAAHECAENGSDESQRNTQDAGISSAFNPPSQISSDLRVHLLAPPPLCPGPFPGPFPPRQDWPRSRYLRCSCCWRQLREHDA